MSTNLLGTTYALEVDDTTAVATNTRGTDANYKLLACLTSNGVEVSVAQQDTSNKCDGGWQTSVPGIGSWTMSGDGQAVSLETGEAATKINYQKILELAVTKEIFFIRMTDATNTVVREGKVFISSYNETAPNAEAYTFTATFTGIGELFITPVVGP